MRTRPIIKTLVVGLAAISLVAAVAGKAKVGATETFAKPTLIAGGVATGTVVFEHDDDRMAKGEPCTTVFAVDPATQERGRVIVEFMCTPRERPVASKFEAICARASIDGSDLLVEYQFAGDREAHGVPVSSLSSLHAR